MNEAGQSENGEQEIEDRRHLVTGVLEPLRRATDVVEALVGDVEQGGRKFVIPKYERPVSCRRAVMDGLNDIALRVVDRLCRRRPSELVTNLQEFKGAIRPYSECLDDLLLISLGLYSNGTPQPRLSQILANELDRIGGLLSVAHMMKAYGDVYRIERRRWKEFGHRRMIRGDIGPPAGILTVVDHSVFVDSGNYVRIEGDQSYSGKKVEEFEGQATVINGLEPDSLRSLTAAMAERMARLYCTFQIIWYVRRGYRIKVLWLPMDTMKGTAEEMGKAKKKVAEWAGNLLKNTMPEERQDHRGQEPEQEMRVLQFPLDGNSPFGLHCVLNSREGVVRELGQPVGSQTSRLTFSAIHHRLRNNIEETLKKHPGEVLFPSKDEKDGPPPTSVTPVPS